MLNVNSTINSCIQIKEIRISRRASIPHQVYFCLDSNLIEQIEWIQENNYKFILDSDNLANLRYYALLNIPLEEIGVYLWRSTKLVFLQRSPLTFTTNYLFPHSQQTLTSFRSAIDLEGKISQQINQEIWQNPQLLSRISQAHYWLITEILAQLALKQKQQNLWLTISYYLIIVSTISLVIDYFFSLSYLLNLVISISIAFILDISLGKIIIKQSKPIILYQLIANFLTKNIRFRKIGWQILSFII